MIYEVDLSSSFLFRNKTELNIKEFREIVKLNNISLDDITLNEMKRELYRDGKQYSDKLELLSKTSIENYLHIFHLSRNYVAHNHINFHLLFENYAKRTSLILDSIIFIMIYLEYLKNR